MKSKLLNCFIIFILGSVILLNTYSNVYAQSGSSEALYQIQPGDTLGSIASLFGISLDSIILANNISDPNSISPGQLIVIPGLTDIHGVITPLILDFGQSINTLAREYSLSSVDIFKLNHITSVDELFAGTRLLIPIPSEFVSPQMVSVSDKLSIIETSIYLNTSPELIASYNNLKNNLRFIYSDFIALPPDIDISVYSINTEKLHVTLSPLPLVQGVTATIWVSTNSEINITGSLNGYDLHFYSDSPGRYFALQGIHAMAETGLTDLFLSIEDGTGIAKHLNYSVLLLNGNFPVDSPIIVDPLTIDPQTTKPENDFIKEFVSHQTNKRFWSGLFQSPAYYQEYTSLFGSRRTYNVDPEITFHGGLDFGGGESLPIVAPADGTIVFSGFLPIRGNAIFIDHGYGVFSGYFHQSKLLVSVGDFVQKGQKIGEVGNTGRVGNANDYPGAGAHLHWEIWVNGVQVNPLDWLSNEYP